MTLNNQIEGSNITATSAFDNLPPASPLKIIYQKERRWKEKDGRNLPGWGTKCLSLRQLVQWKTTGVSSVWKEIKVSKGQRAQNASNGLKRTNPYGVAPPALNSVDSYLAVLRILQAEKDDNNGNSDSGIKSGGQDVWRSKIVIKNAARGGSMKNGKISHNCT